MNDEASSEVITIGAWIKSLRLYVCMLTSILAITGFILTETSISWISVVTMFFIACASTLQNDWRDRFHDIRKGKMLARKHERAFLALLSLSWAVSIGLIILAATQNIKIGIALTILAVIGLVYSEARLLPFIPITLVSFGSASPAILPLAVGAGSEKLWLLFISATLIIFGREITKDIDDKQIDKGYKWTIPLVLGERYSRIIAAVAIATGLVVVAKISLMILPSALLAIMASIMLISGAKPNKSRKYLDIGILFIILTLIIFR